MPPEPKGIDFGELDPGIREAVRLLRQHGFVTTDSGDGVSKPPDQRDLSFPHIFCVSTRERFIDEADRLATLLPKWSIEATYSPADGVFVIAAYGAGE